MADILISAVSAVYTGTENADDFQNSKGSLRDITVQGLSGSDFLTIASGTQFSDGTDGERLSFSMGSSELRMGAGEDTIDFVGTDAPGAAQLRTVDVKLGAGNDLARFLGLASASASTIRGNEGEDDIRLNSFSAGGATAELLRLNGNAGSDEIQFNWSGTEVNGFGVLGGADADTISAVFDSRISGNAAADTNFTGAKIGGSKGDDSLDLNFLGTSEQVRINGNSGSDTIVVTAAADVDTFTIAGGKDDDEISAVFIGGNTSEAATVVGSACKVLVARGLVDAASQLRH